MTSRKKLFTIGIISGVSLFVLVVGGGLVLARQSYADKAEAQGVLTTDSQTSQSSAGSQVLSANNNVGLTATTNTNNIPASIQSSSSYLSTSANNPTNSSINNEDGHETSSPPSDQLVEVETGVLAGSVTTIANVPGDPTGAVSKPFQAKILIKNLKGTTIAEIMPSADGNFAIHLEPGKYKVVPQDVGSFYFTPGALFVDIVAGETSSVSFDYSPIGTTN